MQQPEVVPGLVGEDLQILRIGLMSVAVDVDSGVAHIRLTGVGG